VGGRNEDDAAVSAKTTGYGAKGIPVDSGRMRQSIHKRRISNIAAGVVTPVGYGEKVRFGAATMLGRESLHFALEDFGAMAKIDGIVQEELSRDFAGLTRKLFSRLAGYSERAIAEAEVDLAFARRMA